MHNAHSCVMRTSKPVLAFGVKVPQKSRFSHTPAGEVHQSFGLCLTHVHKFSVHKSALVLKTRMITVTNYFHAEAECDFSELLLLFVYNTYNAANKEGAQLLTRTCD